MQIVSIFKLWVVFVVFLDVTQGFLLEVAKLLPKIGFGFKPVVMYEAGGRRVTPNTVNIIKANNYPVETHLVHTDDGYILEMHRIPYGIRSGPHPNKFPVILQHGNFQSSADWVLNSPANYSLGFLLADNGYDVWMGNQRGNSYSYGHESYPLSSSRYWNFTFHDIGFHDVTGMIDYVIRVTGKPKVHFVSFSLGTTAFYAGLSLRPEYNSKVALGVTMGPSVFQDNFINGAAKLIAFSAVLGDALQSAVGSFPILPHFIASFLHFFLPLFCNPKFDILGICINVMHLLFGHDGGLIDKSQIPLITSVAPSPSGFKSWNHVVQLVQSLRFAEYDYGPRGNMELYGRRTPPDYNLTNVRAPIAIFVGQNDYLAHREDAKVLASRLPNLVEFYTVPYAQFTHLDFSYGRDVVYLVYIHLLNLLDRFNV